jgi:hypothetical protein
MRVVEHSPEHLEYYRNKEFSALDGRNAMEDVATPQPQGDVEGKPAEKDPLSQEQEQQLETWMSDIKAFIRNIDISKL